MGLPLRCSCSCLWMETEQKFWRLLIVKTSSSFAEEVRFPFSQLWVAGESFYEKKCLMLKKTVLSVKWNDSIGRNRSILFCRDSCCQMWQCCGWYHSSFPDVAEERTLSPSPQLFIVLFFFGQIRRKKPASEKWVAISDPIKPIDLNDGHLTVLYSGQ